MPLSVVTKAVCSLRHNVVFRSAKERPVLHRNLTLNAEKSLRRVKEETDHYPSNLR